MGQILNENHVLQDSYQRKFTYLRLSITDRCNFKCNYCLPHGYIKPAGLTEEELSLNELRHLFKGVARAGFKKIRLTGGEPTTRSDLLQIMEAAAELNSFSKIGLSTNGWNLKKQAGLFKLSGVTHLNVSVDSLDPDRFHRLTGKNQLIEILEGIDLSLQQNFSSVKINAVLHRENFMEELARFQSWIKDRPVSVRFIELMKTGDRAQYYQDHFISSGKLKQHLLSEGWTIVARQNEDGPAVEFKHPNSQGRIGIIAPYSQDFCATCNRLRVTSRGKLRLCLFGDSDYSIRPWLQSEALAEQLPVQLQKLLEHKTAGHRLHEGKTGNVTNFSMMGG